MSSMPDFSAAVRADPASGRFSIARANYTDRGDF